MSQEERDDQTPVTGLIEELRRERKATKESLEEAGEEADGLKRAVIIRTSTLPSPPPLVEYRRAR